jgi:hypothetical protein
VPLRICTECVDERVLRELRCSAVTVAQASRELPSEQGLSERQDGLLLRAEKSRAKLTLATY